MATVGETTQLAGNAALAHTIWTNWVEVPNIWRPASISVYVKCKVSGMKIRGMIYEYLSDGEAGALLAKTALTDVPATQDGWMVLSILGTHDFAKGKYHLAVNGVGETADANFEFSYLHDSSQIAGMWCHHHVESVSNPCCTGKSTSINYSTISLYCTYTALAAASFVTRATCEAVGCYWYNDVCHASPYFSHDEYISGYVTRFLKRQMVGFFQESGDLRSIKVCASGEVVVCSGLHVVTDVAVTISGLDIEVNISGDPVIISGQPVSISGQPVTISGNIVNISGQAMTIGGALIQVPVDIQAVYKTHSETWSGVLGSGDTVCTSGVDVSTYQKIGLYATTKGLVDLSVQASWQDVSGNYCAVADVSGNYLNISGCRYENIGHFPFEWVRVLAERTEQSGNLEIKWARAT